MREVRSFCRICTGGCGMRLTIDNNDRIVKIRGDREQPMTRGYACFKGLQAAEAHHGPSRLLHSLKRMPDGSYAKIPSEQAFDEIAEKMVAIRDAHGPEALGLFCGNGSMPSFANFGMQRAFVAAIGSHQRFTTFTLDQSAKLVSFERLGGWAGGTQELATSDVVMMFGANPLISHSAIGVLCVDPVKRLKKAKARGLKLIVIDPRRTETAVHADIFLQPLPGQDVAIAAAMLRLILSERWEDADFCQRFVGAEGMAKLRSAVDYYTLEVAAGLAGLKAEDLRNATETFARKGSKGIAMTATGPNFGPFSNLSQHLVDCLNVVCGRYPRAGDTTRSVDVLVPADLREEVIPPPRSWSAFPPSRIRGVGMLNGERLSGTLADEILTPGEGQIRSLIVDGGNPAISVPDQHKMLKALRSLELLVVVDPYMTATAKMADYVIAPRLQYERSDLPFTAPGLAFWPVAWSQYTAPVIRPPAGSDVVENWYVFWALAKRMGAQITYDGKVDLDMDVPPSSEELLAIRASGATVPFEEIMQFEGGNVWDIEATVQPGTSDARFDVMPDDVLGELEEATQAARRDLGAYPFLLATRRLRDFFNSNGYYLKSVRDRNPINPLFLNPDDMAQLGLADGDSVEITSDNGSIRAMAKTDDTLRTGVVTIAHCFGELPDADDWKTSGTSINPLIADDRDFDRLNAMPRMTAVPVSIRPIN